MLTVKILKNNFSHGLKTVKGWGFRYDAATQTWSGKTPLSLQSASVDRAGYLRNASLQEIAAPVTPATTWQGGRSMDAENSIF